jgi:hypothetical protein
MVRQIAEPAWFIIGSQVANIESSAKSADRTSRAQKKLAAACRQLECVTPVNRQFPVA